MHIDLGDSETVDIDELWAITECIICKRNLTLKSELSHSKLLPCLHAMCYKCFVRCCDRGNPKCPCCSFSFNKDEIYDNKVLYEIVSDSDIPNIKDIVCTIHDTNVTHWCENCNEFICQDCVNHHGQLKSTRSHKIMTKENYISNVLCGTPKIAFPCELHPTNELSIICHSCQAMTCRDCQLELHKDHKFDFIADKADTAKTELYDVFKKVEFFSVMMNAAVSKISDREKKIEDLKLKILEDIKNKFSMIEQLLRKRANELMASTIESANSKLKECELNRTLLKKDLKSVEHCVKFVKCVLYTSSDPVLFYTKDLMLNRMKRLHFDTRIPSAVDFINFSFKYENIEEIKESIQKFGAILDSEDPAAHNVGYWDEVLAALYSEYKERDKLVYAKRKSENLKALQSQTEQLAIELKENSPTSSVIEICSDEEQTPVLKQVFSNSQEKSKKQLPTKVFSNSQEKSKKQLPTKMLTNSEEKGQKQLSKYSSPKVLTNSQEKSQKQLCNNSPPKMLTNSEENSQKELSKCSPPKVLTNSQEKSQKQLSTYSPPKTWHIPETVRLTSVLPLNDSEMGNGIKKVRIPAQNPVLDRPTEKFTDLEALDEVLKDLVAFEESEKQVREISREEQSPTGLPNDFWCSVCLGTGGLISCNNCPKVFHRACHLPSIPFPLPTKWTCILCQEITPRSPQECFKQFTRTDLRIANRLLLELFCQFESSAPFKQLCHNTSCSRFVCLLDIKSYLLSGHYPTILHFIQDVKMMFKNCYRHRQAEPEVIAHAHCLQEIFNRLLSKFIPHVNINKLLHLYFPSQVN